MFKNSVPSKKQKPQVVWLVQFSRKLVICLALKTLTLASLPSVAQTPTTPESQQPDLSAKGGGSIGVGGGGDAFVKPTGEVLFFDLAERRPFSPLDLNLKTQIKVKQDNKIVLLTTSLEGFLDEKRFFFPALGRRILEKFNSGEVGWFFSEGTLTDIQDEELKRTLLDTSLFLKGSGDGEKQKTGNKTRIEQAAVYFENNVIVNRPLFEKMDDESKIYLLVHEALRSIFEEDGGKEFISSAGLRLFTSMVLDPNATTYKPELYLPRFSDAFLGVFNNFSGAFDPTLVKTLSVPGTDDLYHQYDFNRVNKFLNFAQRPLFTEFQQFIESSSAGSTTPKSARVFKHSIVFGKLLTTLKRQPHSRWFFSRLTYTNQKSFDEFTRWNPDEQTISYEPNYSLKVMQAERNFQTEVGTKKIKNMDFYFAILIDSQEYLSQQKPKLVKHILGVYSWGGLILTLERVFFSFDLETGSVGIYRIPISPVSRDPEKKKMNSSIVFNFGLITPAFATISHLDAKAVVQDFKGEMQDSHQRLIDGSLRKKVKQNDSLQAFVPVAKISPDPELRNGLLPLIEEPEEMEPLRVEDEFSPEKLKYAKINLLISLAFWTDELDSRIHNLTEKQNFLIGLQHVLNKSTQIPLFDSSTVLQPNGIKGSRTDSDGWRGLGLPINSLFKIFTAQELEQEILRHQKEDKAHWEQADEAKK